MDGKYICLLCCKLLFVSKDVRDAMPKDIACTLVYIYIYIALLVCAWFVALDCVLRKAWAVVVAQTIHSSCADDP